MTEDYRSPEGSGCRAYLDTLYPGADGAPGAWFVNIRVISPDSTHPPHTEQLPTADLGNVDARIQALSTEFPGSNIYIGVLPRATQDGGGGADNVLHATAVFVDLDLPPGMTADAALGMIDLLSEVPPPSIVVHSGNGLHLYWLLDSPLPLEPAGELAENRRRTENINRGLVEALEAYGADPRAVDVARVLRPPGTINYPDAKKREAGREPAPVRILRCAPHLRYSLDDHLKEFEDRGARQPTARAPAVVSYEQRPYDGELPSKVEALMNRNPDLLAIAMGEQTDHLQDESDSGIDQSLANHLAMHRLEGWEIEHGLRWYRSERGGKDKHDAYWHGTVGRALAYRDSGSASQFPDDLPSPHDEKRPASSRRINVTGRGRGSVRWARDVKERRVEFHWNPYVPENKPTLIEGPPAVGKTTLATDLTARLTTGAPFPEDDAWRRPMRVLVASAEDDYDDTLVPRLRVAGADLRNVGFFEVKNQEGIDLPFLIEDLDDLVDEVRRERIELVYLDAIMSTLGGVNTHKDNEVRQALARLTHGLRSAGAQWIGTRHLHKGDKASAVYAGGGSIAFTALARSVLLCGRDPDYYDDPNRGVLAHTKGNVGRRGRSLRYEIVEAEPGVTRLEWRTDEPCYYTADEIVAYRLDDRRGDERRECAAWLREWWGDRESALATEVREAAGAEGHNWGPDTWRRAREDSGIATTRGGQHSRWYRPRD